MKPLVLLLCLALPQLIRAEDAHRYDVLAKAIMPFLSVLAKERKTEARAFSLKVRIEQATGLPVELRGASAEIALQVPDKLRLRGPLLGETFSLVRNGEKVWISPGAKARALLDAAVDGKTLPPSEKGFELGEFKLPFPEKQLVFLTTLFSVKDQGFELLDGVECRVLDVSLLPEVAESIEAEGWVSRLWVRPDHTPARITFARKGWHIVLRIDDVQFAKSLPQETWEPSAEEQGDVLELKPKQYSRFLGAIGGRKDKSSKK